MNPETEANKLVNKKKRVKELASQLFASQFAKIDLSVPSNQREATQKVEMVKQTISSLAATAVTAAIMFENSSVSLINEQITE